MEVPLGVDTDTATLAWLASALELARSQGQSKAVASLEDVADDVVFELESAARRCEYRESYKI
jgi:hypothetical protein